MHRKVIETMQSLASKLIDEALVETELSEFIASSKLKEARRTVLSARIDSRWGYYNLTDEEMTEYDAECERRWREREEYAALCDGGPDEFD